MLEGKPSGETEAVTMGAIKSILTQHKDDIQAIHAARNGTPAPQQKAEPVSTAGQPTLQPVKPVDAKIRSARFTTVPVIEDQPTVATSTLAAKATPTATVEASQAEKFRMAQAKAAQLKAARTKALQEQAARQEALRAKKAQIEAELAERERLAAAKLKAERVEAAKLASAEQAQDVEDRVLAPLDMPEIDVEAEAAVEEFLTNEAKAEQAEEAAKPGFKVPSVKPKHVALAAVALLVALRPAWVVMALLLTVFCVMGAFLFLGADRIWGAVTRRLNGLDKTDPRRAARARKRLDAIALRWDAVLDRFPDGTVDGLYMPDFTQAPDLKKQNEAIIEERLTRMHSQV